MRPLALAPHRCLLPHKPNVLAQKIAGPHAPRVGGLHQRPRDGGEALPDAEDGAGGRGPARGSGVAAGLGGRRDAETRGGQTRVEVAAVERGAYAGFPERRGDARGGDDASRDGR
jgi:hypothetical protein